MYKVFIKDKVILFSKKHTNFDAQFKSVLKLTFFQQSSSMIYTQLLNNDKKLNAIIFELENPEEAFHQFSDEFTLIKAAGGVVKNKEDKLLVIYRLEKWDLPKGKLEKGEKIEEAAVREVEEECAVNGLQITKALNDTFHIYHIKENPILKQTYWFEMQTDFEGELIPQTEEGIEEVKWVGKKELESLVLKNTYASIADFLITDVC
ncbi:MAG: NUDIX domain-containing protein [Flavobacteriales bacterium]|nr:NUDIX domain-containing protein [Flavobacteriales bacterium]